MARNYRHIQSYEREIKEMLGQGMTHRETPVLIRLSDNRGSSQRGLHVCLNAAPLCYVTRSSMLLGSSL